MLSELRLVRASPIADCAQECCIYRQMLKYVQIGRRQVLTSGPHLGVEALQWSKSV